MIPCWCCGESKYFCNCNWEICWHCMHCHKCCECETPLGFEENMEIVKKRNQRIWEEVMGGDQGKAIL